MTFTPQFLDEIRSRVPLDDFIGRRVRLVRRGREHVALCPFHSEKTPSFTVSEEKGFFHCFGCGAHGDVIAFLMRIDNLSFPEVVVRLAREAGLPLPARDPAARARAERDMSLYAVLETASAWFGEQLATQGGKTARDYLARRGIDDATLRAFRLGWAPDERATLKTALAARGVSEATMLGAGLVVVPDDGRASFDRFRGRIVFPITDQSGRVIAFGGRGLGAKGPKYLNSPETPIFHKSSVLYGLAEARRAARETGTMVVTEGYMDVLALHQAGFRNTVAPLGTALTETQMTILWRLAPEPILCFDGDAAGQRAARAAAERALSMLKPGQSLRFATLPQGLDPDNLIDRRWAESLRGRLATARQLVDVLWEANLTGRKLDTPERQAAFEHRLRRLAQRITDPVLRRHYERYFNDRLWQQSRRTRTVAGRRSRRRDRIPVPEPTALPTPDPLGVGLDADGSRRERVIVTVMLNHPKLLAKVEEDLATAPIKTPELDRLRRAMLEIAARVPDLDSAALKRHLSERGFAQAVDRLVATQDWSERRVEDWFAGPGAALKDAEQGLRNVVARHRRAVELEAERKTVQAELAEDITEATFDRFVAVQGLAQEGDGDEAELDEFGSASGRETNT